MGGGPGGHRTPPPPHSTAICNFIQAWRIEKHESANSFFGGRREGISEEVETLGEAPPPFNDRLPRAVKNYAVFLP